MPGVEDTARLGALLHILHLTEQAVLYLHSKMNRQVECPVGWSAVAKVRPYEDRVRIPKAGSDTDFTTRGSSDGGVADRPGVSVLATSLLPQAPSLGTSIAAFAS